MQENESLLERVAERTENLKSSMSEQISLLLDANPDADKAEFKENYLLNKIATLLVSMEELAKRIRVLEGEK